MTDDNKKMQFVRIWVELDMNDVRQHLLMADESLGSCATCREIGLKLQSVKTCPKCGTEFRYVTTKPTGIQKTVDPKVLARIREKRPDLTLVDWTDYDHGQGKLSARELLNL